MNFSPKRAKIHGILAIFYPFMGKIYLIPRARPGDKVPRRAASRSKKGQNDPFWVNFEPVRLEIDRSELAQISIFLCKT